MDSSRLELLGRVGSKTYYLLDGHRPAFGIEAQCAECGESFEAIRVGRRGRYPTRCSSCLAPKRRGRKRSGGSYVNSDGRVIVSPIDDSERSFPTSWKSGRIHRSHLVWNRAHPEDLVLPGEEIDHRNGDKADDRIENLRKFANHKEHMAAHAAEETAGYKPKARTCAHCGKEFVGKTVAKFCSKARCRRAMKAAHADRAKKAAREKRQAASAHGCVNCGATIHGRAVYCKAVACQRERQRLKQLAYRRRARSSRRSR